MSRPSWPFYAGWILTSAISMPVAFLIALAILAQVVKVVGATIQVGGQSHITEDFLLSYILLPLIGLLTGLVQGLLLRRYLRRAAWWVAATAAGWGLFSVGVPFAPLFATGAPPALAGVVLGGTLGLLQWLVLRPRVTHAALWILASVCAWVAPFLIIGGVMSNQTGAMSVIQLPPIITSLALWLLFDRLPRRANRGDNTPSGAPTPLASR